MTRWERLSPNAAGVPQISAGVAAATGRVAQAFLSALVAHAQVMRQPDCQPEIVSPVSPDAEHSVEVGWRDLLPIRNTGAPAVCFEAGGHRPGCDACW